jgi:ketosteroid isomerase-like protein
MSSARETVNQAIKAHADGDLDGFMALVAEDAVFRGPGGPGGHEVRGRAAIRAMVENEMAAWPARNYEIRRQFVDGDAVITEVFSTSTHQAELTLATGEKVAATGRTVTEEAVYIDHVVDGKIVDSVAYYDRHALLIQMGLLPVPATAAGV